MITKEVQVDRLIESCFDLYMARVRLAQLAKNMGAAPDYFLEDLEDIDGWIYSGIEKTFADIPAESRPAFSHAVDFEDFLKEGNNIGLFRVG